MNEQPTTEPIDVHLLWHSSYYDGPLSGMCQYRGERFWFQCYDERDYEAEGDWYRRYKVYRLTEAELTRENEQHAAFQEHVGSHTDYDENGKRQVGAVKPESEWPKFYDHYKGQPDYTNNECVGWFQV